MEIQGKIIAVLPPRNGISQKSGEPWVMQSYVLETLDQYPKKVPFDVFGADKVQRFNIKMGETLTVRFDLDGREHNGRWYVSVRCYDVVRGTQSSPVAPAPAPSQAQAHPQPQPVVGGGSFPPPSAPPAAQDDLPF